MTTGTTTLKFSSSGGICGVMRYMLSCVLKLELSLEMREWYKNIHMKAAFDTSLNPKS